MPRPARIHREGALYLVTCRAEPTSTLFKDQRDIDTYLGLLSFYKTKHNLKLFAYTLTSDHLHLCLEVGAGATVSAFMHNLNSRYTKLYCSRHNWRGHLFQGRFRSVVVEKDPYLLRLTRYLHAYPNALANSFSHYLKQEASWIDREDLFSRFPSEDPAQAYERFVQAAVAEELEQIKRILQQPIVGSPEFIRMLQERPEPVSEPAPELEAKQRGFEMIFMKQSPRSLALVGTVCILSSVVGARVFSEWITGPAKNRAEAFIQAAAAQTTQPVIGSTNAAHLAALTMPLSLEGTAWDLKIKPMGGLEDAAVQADRLEFDGRRVVSSWLSNQGFNASNYTWSSQAGDLFTWETMQTGPKGEVVCWRGEWDGRTMRGIMTRQLPGGEIIPFNFIGFPQGRLDGNKTSET